MGARVKGDWYWCSGWVVNVVDWWNGVVGVVDGCSGVVGGMVLWV